MGYLALLLRELVDDNYDTKGSELSFEELDTNFKLIGDAIAGLSVTDTSAFDEYDPDFEYQGGVTYYVSYAGNIWKFISPIPRTGIAPGTDPTIWELSSSGELAHERNKDEYLALGTPDEVSANEIRTFIDSFGVIPNQILLRSTGPSEYTFSITIDDTGTLNIEESTGGIVDEIFIRSNGTLGHRFKMTIDDTGTLNFTDLGI